MIKLYSDEDLYDAVVQYRKILFFFLGVTAAFLAGLILLIVFYRLLPYNDPATGWYTAGAGILTAAYLLFTFPYMGIKFKRSRAYCKLMKNISTGLKEYAVIPFKEIENWTTRDGVDVNVAVFTIPNPKGDEEMLRQIYVDGEKEFPAFEEGKKAKLVSHGNLLIEYELE